MGKSDLRINFQTIHDVQKSVKTYKNALGNMEKSVASIEDIIGKGKGQTVEKLVGKSSEFKNQIKDVKEELEDLTDILDRYIKEMTAIISPVQKNQLMQVDKEDIYWNKQDIIGACQGVYCIPMTSSTYGIPGGFTLNDTQEETEKKKRNYQKLQEIKKKLTNSSNEFNPLIDKLNTLYKVVQEYEDKDDEFKKEASGLTDKYTDFWEGLARFFSSVWNGIKEFVTGLLVSVTDLVTGLVTMGKGLWNYGKAAVEVGFDILVDKDIPTWAQDDFDKGNNIVAAIVNDPAIIVEGMAQGISDAWEEEGVAYGVGYATGIVLSFVAAKKGAKGISKISKGGRAVSSIDDLIKAGVTGAEELAKYGINTVDDLIRIGVKSVDGLERLGLTSVEQLSKLGISSIDDLVRLGISSVDDLERLGLTSAEALKKVGITDASKLVEKGIASEKELAEIGIKGGSKTSTGIESLLNNRAELTGTTREKLLSTVQDSELAKIVNELYRPGATVGDGGTASILVEEFSNGSSKHLIKASERLKQLKNLSTSGKLGLNDLDVVDALIDDLESAINLFN